MSQRLAPAGTQGRSGRTALRRAGLAALVSESEAQAPIAALCASTPLDDRRDELELPALRRSQKLVARTEAGVVADAARQTVTTELGDGFPGGRS